MSFDFTGQNIEDTYHRLLQVSGSDFYDGTGSAVLIGGSQNLQQVTDQGASTTTSITASIISASGAVTVNELTAEQLTVDSLKLNGNTLSSTSDTDVAITLGLNGIGFEATDSDKFTFNTNQNNIDFHFTSQGDQNMFYIDSDANKIGIGTNTPGEKLEIIGNVSASGTGSFALVKATNIEGNSPLNIRGVSKLIFDSTLGDTPSAEFYGNPIFHSDTNIYSGSAFLGTDDDLIFRSNDSTDTLEIGGNRYKTKIEGAGIELVQTLTASLISASGAITASNLSGTNTGDQDLSSYIQNSQTSSMSVATASFIGTINGGTF